MITPDRAPRSRVRWRPEIMRGQLRHLLSLLYRRADLAIRVLPNGVYGNPARGGGFAITSEVVRVRDSKNQSGPSLAVETACWRSFLAKIGG
ncbi:MAG: Scr1 family TA system antitoxin-like transcriptional regulator [Kibdelosporangium sp.]